MILMSFFAQLIYLACALNRSQYSSDLPQRGLHCTWTTRVSKGGGCSNSKQSYLYYLWFMQTSLKRNEWLHGLFVSHRIPSACVVEEYLNIATEICLGTETVI